MNELDRFIGFFSVRPDSGDTELVILSLDFTLNIALDFVLDFERF